MISRSGRKQLKRRARYCLAASWRAIYYLGDYTNYGCGWAVSPWQPILTIHNVPVSRRGERHPTTVQTWPVPAEPHYALPYSPGNPQFFPWIFQCSLLPVYLRHHSSHSSYITCAQMLDHVMQHGALSTRTTDHFLTYLLAPCLLQGIYLYIQMLVSNTDAGVPNFHAPPLEPRVFVASIIN